MLQKQRGQLKIFLGYAAGVGKTYAMLKEAHEQLALGRDVVIGYVEPHARPETNALIEGVEQIATLQVHYNNRLFNELNLNAILARKPDLVLVDELAHTNTPGLRHEKRFGDVEELLNAGINVYTTLNIQHIESLHDLVEEITHITVRERVPDHIVDQANQIQLVDIEPIELIDRLRLGKIYSPSQAAKAMDHFFQHSNLIALREIALRRVADSLHQKIPLLPIAEHILVGISSSPTNAKVIRTASRLVQALHAEFSCLYVKNNDSNLSPADLERLKSNLMLAEQLGGTIVTVEDDNVAVAIAHYAQISGVTKLVLGKTVATNTLFNRSKISDVVNTLVPNLAFYIVPDQDNVAKRFKLPQIDFSLKPFDFLKLLIIFTTVIVIGLIFQSFGINEANIITLFIMGVLLMAFWTTSWIMNFISSTFAVVSFNFFFIAPIFSLEVYRVEYPMTFIIMFLSGLLTSSLAKKVKRQGLSAAKNAYRVETLLETNRKLQSVNTLEQLIAIGTKEIIQTTSYPVIFYEVHEGAIHNETFFSSPLQTLATNERYEAVLFNKDEKAIALWCVRNNRAAGATTSVFKEAHGYYLPFISNKEVVGVIGITLSKKEEMPSFERQILHAIINEFSLAYEQQLLVTLNMAVEQEKELEKIQSNLLRSISHDLRTPLTSISGNADMLRSNAQKISMQQRQTLYEDIYYNSNRLVQLVENLLAVSKLSNNHFPLQIQEELVEDMFREALAYVSKNSKRSIQISIEPTLLTVLADTRLIGQVIINLLDNAINYTAPECDIVLAAYSEEKGVVIEVRDNGVGIPDEQKAAIFQSFKQPHVQSSDSTRGLGIGLSLCQNILHLHQSKLFILDNIPQGSIFRFYLIEGGHYHDEEKNTDR